SQATWVAVNDYEGKMLAERTGQSLAELSKSHLKGLIETLGADGCNVWIQGEKTHVPGVKAAAVVDPTGCGDAFRGGLLYG
ncbi:carbohydrate kinase family protein, partial [Klebsiella pneumoniae]|nr:carbohydrate kinase family protein [Klebsiella pneumoniae]